MDGTPTGETVTPAAPSNDPGTTAAPISDNGSNAELEAARKEKAQMEMRLNQLQNQLAAKEKAEAEARQKQLEEQEEFKTLYEQTQARLNEIQETQAAQERSSQLQSATQDVFKDYPETVVELAKTAGLSLAEDTDEARNALKEKLDVFKAQVGGSNPTARSNNPHSPAPTQAERAQLTARDKDGASPMALAGAKGDDSVVRSYIRQIPAIQRMKDIAIKGA